MKVTFLLILTRGCTEGNKVFGLSMILIQPYQARVATLEEAVKLLTPLPSTGSDCPYALVWPNGDACHVPLPKKGQLNVQVAGGTGNITCERVSQLQVCHLLSSGSQIVYPVGLNGCEVPLITSPPEQMAKGINLLSGEPVYLKVDIPQSNREGPELKAPPLGGHSPSTLIASSVRPPSPKAEGEVSITMEVRELLSWAGLDTSEHASGSSTPKRQEPVVLVTPLPTKLEDFSRPVDMSSQMSAADNAEMEEIPTPSSPTAEALEPSSDVPSPDEAHLWEEANKALGDLLAIKSSIDVHGQKLISEFGMVLHQNNSKTTESIKEVKAICTHSIQEAKDHCSVAIREAEAQRVSQAISLQQSQHKTVQHLEEESIKEGRKGQLNFLSVCQTALWVSPPKFHSVLVASYHILLGHAPMSHQCLHPFHQGLPPGFLPLPHWSIHLGPSDSITLQIQWIPCLSAGPCPRQLLRGPLPWSGER